jgi:urease gamma subunit
MFGSETTALLRAVLDEVCEQVGRHENGTRTHVAARLLQAARDGSRTVDELREMGREALRTAPGY